MKNYHWSSIVEAILLVGMWLVGAICLGYIFGYSFTESSCSILNSTIEDNKCCAKASDGKFDAVWIVNVNVASCHHNQYLVDIRENFKSYYAALDAISVRREVRPIIS